MDKPKEFWIYGLDDGLWVYPFPIEEKTDIGGSYLRSNNGDGFFWKKYSHKFHVIEYSAYEQLQKSFDEAVEVIKFYSNGGSLSRDIWFDEKLGYFTGKRAREFLRSRTIQETKGE